MFAPQPAQAVDPGLPQEPVLAPQPVLTPEEMRSPEPVLSPEPLRDARESHQPAHAFAPVPLSAAEAAQAAQPSLAAEPEPQHAAQPAHPQERTQVHNGVEALQEGEHAHVSAGVFDRLEPDPPLEAGATVPPDIAHETEAAAQLQPHLDADLIAEHLRGRFAGFLTGEGRGIIEAHCRDALQEHTTLLVSQITREVALTLETEMTGWVREAVEEEIGRRSGRS